MTWQWFIIVAGFMAVGFMAGTLFGASWHARSLGRALDKQRELFLDQHFKGRRQ